MKKLFNVAVVRNGGQQRKRDSVSKLFHVVGRGLSTSEFLDRVCVCYSSLVSEKKQETPEESYYTTNKKYCLARSGRHRKLGLIRSLTVLQLQLHKNITTSRKKKLSGLHDSNIKINP